MACTDTPCPGRLNGHVDIDVIGGTQIPFEFLMLVQGPRGELYSPLYTYSVQRPDGIGNTPFLADVPEGPYFANVSDFNGCLVQAECTVGAVAPPMRLRVVNSTEPECITSSATVVFEVENCTQPCTLMKVGPAQGPVAGGNTVILQDDTVIPNQDFF
jgi:hypothetical protein